MTRNTIDWTHKRITINDIRKLTKLYVIKIHDSISGEAEQIESALFIKDIIFEERLKSYFLKDITKITREEILSVNWNMYITKGYYIKINDKGDVEEFHHDTQKMYVSYLEIDGPLGTFSSIYRDNELCKQ